MSVYLKISWQGVFPEQRLLGKHVPHFSGAENVGAESMKVGYG